MENINNSYLSRRSRWSRRQLSREASAQLYLQLDSAIEIAYRGKKLLLLANQALWWSSSGSLISDYCAAGRKNSNHSIWEGHIKSDYCAAGRKNSCDLGYNKTTFSAAGRKKYWNEEEIALSVLYKLKSHWPARLISSIIFTITSLLLAHSAVLFM